MTPRNLCYAQSGGVTAVINATAAGVFSAARRDPKVGKILAARNGILGVLREEILEVWRESPAQLRALAHTPGGAFGSCRVKLPAADDPKGAEVYRRIFSVFRAHDVGYFVYNGGNDSADTTMKIAAMARRMSFPLECVGAPKTIDNDLAATDNCPGFGSAAKYVAVSVSEAALDVASMHRTSTKVFILEVMGRHAGWLAAAAGLPEELNAGPGMILFPEIPFDRAKFARAVAWRVRRFGYAVATASEGLRDAAGNFLSAAERADAFSHAQLGGVAPRLAEIVGADLGLKCHWGVSDYLQRSARHIASAVDAKQAEALGAAAAGLATAGRGGTMAVLERISDSPYRWRIGAADLSRAANREKKMPRRFISRDGFRITAECRRYMSPLIRGEAFPPFGPDGLPKTAKLKNIQARKKLPKWRG